MAVSSPSGDVHGAERVRVVCAALLPDEATIERVPCSSPGPRRGPRRPPARHRRAARRCCVGHIDTVVAHAEHRPLERVGEQLVGSGSVDMKGGVILAHRRAARLRPAPRALRRSSRCCSSATRSGGRRTSATSRASRASTPACASRRASSRAPTRASSCGARRRARSTSPRTGAARTRGSAPDRGRNALLALGRGRAGWSPRATTRTGPAHLTAVPTVHALRRRVQRRPRHRRALLRPARRRPRRDRGACSTAIPAEHRRRPARGRADPPLAGHALRGGDGAACSRARARRSAAPVAPAARGGASDASHFAATIPITVDGLGPRGGKAHNPEEFVLEASLQPRAEVALARDPRRASGG